MAGYTFDIVDLNNTLLIRKGEFDYIKENKENKFFKLIIDEISRTSSDDLLNNNKKLLLYTLSKFLKRFFKNNNYHKKE